MLKMCLTRNFTQSFERISFETLKIIINLPLLNYTNDLISLSYKFDSYILISSYFNERNSQYMIKMSHSLNYSIYTKTNKSLGILCKYYDTMIAIKNSEINWR